MRRSHKKHYIVRLINTSIMRWHSRHGVVLSTYCDPSFRVCKEKFSISTSYGGDIQSLELSEWIHWKNTWTAYKLLVGRSDCSNVDVKKSNLFHISLESKWQKKFFAIFNSCSSIHKNGKNTKVSDWINQKLDVTIILFAFW